MISNVPPVTARAMVMQYGMYEKMGLIAYGNEWRRGVYRQRSCPSRSYSEEVAKEIDQEIHDIIDGCHAKAKEIILQHMDVLHKCAELLLEKEKVQRDENLRHFLHHN